MAITQIISHNDNDARVWLITGTSSGMGRALVKSALDRNDKVIATARVLEQIQDLRSLADPSRLYLMQLDITDSQDVITAKVNEAIDVWGRIDVLVNNAGTGVKMILEEGGYVSFATCFGSRRDCLLLVAALRESCVSSKPTCSASWRLLMLYYPT